MLASGLGLLLAWITSWSSREPREPGREEKDDAGSLHGCLRI